MDLVAEAQVFGGCFNLLSKNEKLIVDPVLLNKWPHFRFNIHLMWT